MPKHFRVLIVCGALFLWSAANLHALTIPERPDGYVTDRAQILSDSVHEQLESRLQAFERETSNQIVVAAFPSLEGESLEDFSIHLAEKWKIGQKDKDNGVILLIFKNDRKVRIEVGYGLEGSLPDAICQHIIQQEIVPQFRQAHYDEGISKAIDALMAATQGEYRGKGEDPSRFARHFFIFLAVMVACSTLFFIVINIAIFRKMNAIYRSRRSGTGKFGGPDNSSGTGSSDFGSSSDSGGGGGGDFGGGGSSGTW